PVHQMCHSAEEVLPGDDGLGRLEARESDEFGDLMQDSVGLAALTCPSLQLRLSLPQVLAAGSRKLAGSGAFSALLRWRLAGNGRTVGRVDRHPSIEVFLRRVDRVRGWCRVTFAALGICRALRACIASRSTSA